MNVLRIALAALTILAVPLASHPLSGVLRASGHDASDSASSDGGSRIVITADALPAETGWFIVPVHADRAAWVELRTESWFEPTTSPAGFALITALGEQPYAPATLFQPETTVVGARHDGEGVGCCSAPLQTSPWEGQGRGPSGRIAPGAPAYVGLAAVGWGPGSSIEITIEAYPDERGAYPTLTAGMPRTGTRVELHDLVAEASANGSGVQLGQAHLVGEPGEAHIKFDAQGTGLVALEAYVDGTARARVALTLSNGTTIDNGNGRSQVTRVHAHTGPGTIGVDLTDLELPAALTQTADDWGWAQAMVLVADVELPDRSLHVETWPTQPRLHPGEGTVLEVNASLLPAGTGWFVVPLEADQAGTVEIVTHINHSRSTGGEAEGAAPIVAAASLPVPFAWDSAGSNEPMAGAAIGGVAASCCPDVGTWSSSSGGGTMFVEVRPGEPVFVGLAAVGWSEDDDLLIQARSSASGFRLGTPRVGTSAFALDLYREAYDAGTHVRVLGQQPVAEAGDVLLGWQVEHMGLVSAMYWMEGDARGDLLLTLPNGTSLDNGEGHDVVGNIVGATGPGRVTLSFRDAHRPGYGLLTTGGEGGGVATLLFADVDIPYRGILGWRGSTDE